MHFATVVIPILNYARGYYKEDGDSLFSVTRLETRKNFHPEGDPALEQAT